MIKGILCVLGASIVFGVSPTGNKYVMLHGVSAICITFYSSVILTVISFLLTRKKGISLKVSSVQMLYLIALGAVCMGGTTALVSLSMNYIPVGLATVLHFLYPTVVSIILALFFHQKFTIWKFFATACSIVGMIFISDLSGAGTSMTGIAIAILSSLTYASFIIANDHKPIDELPLPAKQFYFGVGSSGLFGILSFVNNDITLPDNVTACLVLIFICGIGYTMAYYLITAGIKMIGASLASFVNMLEPVASVVVSTVIYKYTIEYRTIAGMVLVLAAVFLIAMDGRRLLQPNK